MPHSDARATCPLRGCVTGRHNKDVAMRTSEVRV